MRQLFLGLSAAMFLSACGGGNASSETAERSGAWDLKSAQSTINYTTVKNNTIAENNTFTLFSGSVEENGDVTIDIALNSVQTNIDTRDERMKKFVFKTNEYPSAEITTSLSMDALSALEIGARLPVVNKISVSLAGLTQSFDTQFMVTRVGTNEVLVESAAPILVSAEDFGLEAGVAKLQELAKLQSITPVVPVSFSLYFER